MSKTGTKVVNCAPVPSSPDDCCARRERVVFSRSIMHVWRMCARQDAVVVGRYAGLSHGTVAQSLLCRERVARPSPTPPRPTHLWSLHVLGTVITIPLGLEGGH